MTRHKKTIKYGGRKRVSRKTRSKRFQKMNCSPAVKATVRDSCFTDEVLETLKASYNKHHPATPVNATKGDAIWADLHDKLSTCSKEDCWLDEIEDPAVRKKLKASVFAPYQPKEWKKNPSTWLSNYDILDVLQQYETAYPNFKVFGPTPIDFDSKPQDMNGKCVWDDLCAFDIEKWQREGKTKLGIVFNLDKHDQGGSHWVSMFVDMDDGFIFYLDSAGERIQPEIEVLVKRIQEQGKAAGISFRFYENHPVEHQMGENECGMYALYFIITMLTGRTEGKVFTSADQKIRFFKQRRIPDKYMNGHRAMYFNPAE